MQEMQEMTDGTLCRLVAEGDRSAEELLVSRYNRLVRMCSRPFFLVGGDSEDLISRRFALMMHRKRRRSGHMRRSVSAAVYTACCAAKSLINMQP